MNVAGNYPVGKGTQMMQEREQMIAGARGAGAQGTIKAVGESRAAPAV